MYVYEYYFLALVRITTGTLLLTAFATSIVVMVAWAPYYISLVDLNNYHYYAPKIICFKYLCCTHIASLYPLQVSPFLEPFRKAVLNLDWKTCREGWEADRTQRFLLIEIGQGCLEKALSYSGSRSRFSYSRTPMCDHLSWAATSYNHLSNTSKFSQSNHYSWNLM